MERGWEICILFSVSEKEDEVKQSIHEPEIPLSMTHIMQMDYF